MKKVFAAFLVSTLLFLCVAVLSACGDHSHKVSEEFEAELRDEANDALVLVLEYFDTEDLVRDLIDKSGGIELFTIVAEYTAKDIYAVVDALEDAFGYQYFRENIIECVIAYYGDYVVDAVIDEYGVEYIIDYYS